MLGDVGRVGAGELGVAAVPADAEPRRAEALDRVQQHPGRVVRVPDVLDADYAAARLGGWQQLFQRPEQVFMQHGGVPAVIGRPPDVDRARFHAERRAQLQAAPVHRHHVREEFRHRAAEVIERTIRGMRVDEPDAACGQHSLPAQDLARVTHHRRHVRGIEDDTFRAEFGELPQLRLLYALVVAMEWPEIGFGNVLHDDASIPNLGLADNGVMRKVCVVQRPVSSKTRT